MSQSYPDREVTTDAEIIAALRERVAGLADELERAETATARMIAAQLRRVLDPNSLNIST